jgi:quaternary ammonium compound-resistance protein SugE
MHEHFAANSSCCTATEQSSMTAELQMLALALGLDALGVLTFKKYLTCPSPTWRKLVAWTILILAGLLEIVWLVALKNSNGFADTGQGVISIAVSWLSFFMLAYALKFIPAGTAYAVWTGCGAVGGVVVGMIIFGEERSPLRLTSIALVIVGILGIRLAESTPAVDGG